MFISITYWKNDECEQAEDDEWSYYEEEETNYFKSIDECTGTFKLSTAVISLTFFLIYLPFRIWMAWNLKDFMDLLREEKQENSSAKVSNTLEGTTINEV